MELKHVWEVGAKTYNVNTCQKFNMRVALMWPVNNFPAYGMLFGWNTLRLLECPICMEKSKLFIYKVVKRLVILIVIGNLY